MDRFDFQGLLERLPLVVYVDQLDEKSTALYVSPQIAQLVGYSQDEWLANPDLFVDSLHPDDRERVLREIAQRNETGGTTTYLDYRLVARDGRVVWIRDEELVVVDADGQPATAHGYLQDVTARRRDSTRLELLVGILSLAADETPPDEIIAAAADSLASLFGEVEVSYVERRAEGGFWIRYTTDEGKPEFWDEVEWSSDYLERITKGPIIVEDVTREEWLAPIRDRLLERGVASSVDVPLLRNGEVTGVLWFNSHRPRTWGEHEVSVLVDVAGQLAIVLASARARELRARAERDLKNRDAILEAVSRSAESFFAHPSLDGAMADLMQVLGQATGASRAYVFENLPGESPAPLTQRRVIWAEPAWTTTVDDPRLGHVRPSPHFPRWAELMGRGEAINSPTRALPDEEREAFALIDCLSIMAVPVFVEGSWWGFIGFEDCENERDWSSAETDALRAASGLVAAAVNRERAERDLNRRDAILDAVSRSAQVLLAAPEWCDAAPDLLRRLGVAAEASRAYIWEHRLRADGAAVAVPRFEWAAEGITPELDDPALQEVCFEENGLGRHWEMFQRNEAVAGNVADFPADERELISSNEILAIINLPIFVGDECWGFIGLDDCATQRDWSAAETDALRTAASLVAAAIARERSDVVLREHEQKLRAVFETALDAIFITDDDRRYVDVNPAGCELIGVAKRDLIGRSVDEFLPPQRLELVRATWHDYIKGAGVQEEWETMRPDGTVVISEASARPNFVPGLHIAFMRDVTDRKRLESELLSSQKLDSLGRLAGGIAHDFNNLLTGITGYASLLLERAGADTELARDLGEIKRAADRAAELTKQLLAFGRRQMLKPHPLDLNVVLADVGGFLQRLIGDHVDLELLPAPDLGVVQADPGQIEQVIINLAVNASNAMPAGGRLSIETRNADDGSVELVVADTGIGMDESTLSQIFEPFFTTRNEGVGLGLASVYGIVHQSGGNVTVESTPGVGSVFTIRLPRILEAAPGAVAVEQPEATPGSETILLVEDEDVVRDLTRRVLERQGYTVLACADGAEAVALAERDDRLIDLLLTDVVMPGLRGYEVARLVTASRPDIKILYMSGYAEEALVGRPALAASALIEKPFAVEALARRVREALEAA
ncbi:MAG TPA: PAS domain S-box protein [Gaiellaceae bacterium]|nr:PAS domain S-box protein [Gaiellaceae bacterium]